MDLITLVLVLALVGFMIWLITTYIPMPDPIKTVIVVLTVIVLVLYVLTRLVSIPNVLR